MPCDPVPLLWKLCPKSLRMAQLDALRYHYAKFGDNRSDGVRDFARTRKKETNKQTNKRAIFLYEYKVSLCSPNK